MGTLPTKLPPNRDCLERDVEALRGGQAASEGRALEATRQAEATKARLHSLQATANRLEESLRTMSQYKHKYAQLKLENSSLNNALETRMQHFQTALNKLTRENESLKAELRSLEAAGSSEQRLGERLEEAERDNQRLIKEREQCEMCLDQVAHQVVKALLAQKGLREEVCSLRERVKELETQNRALSSLLLQQIPKQQLQPNNTSLEVCVRPVSCDDTKLRWADSLLWVPVHRPRSLNLDTQQPVSPKAVGENHIKDEGYSTMSSEAQGESGNSTGTCGPLERLQEESTTLFLDTIHHPRACEDDVVLSMRLVSGRQSFPPPQLLRSCPALLRSRSDSQLGQTQPTRWSVKTEQTIEPDWWEADSCIEAWLRLEETRSAVQVDYDPLIALDLEEWTMDDITPGLSSIAESGAELEDLWCPVIDGQYSLISPGGDSWSSQGTSEDQSESKRSSTMSDQSDCPAPTVGTDFTRDFYRLVKFESTKSLASTSSRSQGEVAAPPVIPTDREQALQSVLHFIEQQQYCRAREVHDTNKKEGEEASETLQQENKTVRDDSQEVSCSWSEAGAKISDEETKLLRVDTRGLLTVPEEEEEHLGSLTSSISTPETILREPPPLVAEEAREAETKEDIEEEEEEEDEEEIIKVSEESEDVLSFDGTRTTKQMIDELKKMAGEEDCETSPQLENVDDGHCCPTGWVHVERDIDFNDPKARANLLDVMMSSRSSSSCSGSSESSDDRGEYQHLHRIHRSRRHKKASASREGAGALRRQGSQRVSIVGREDLFLRYGAKEREAIASFDFLDELTSASSRESTTRRSRETLQ